jgi:hypothetical protein
MCWTLREFFRGNIYSSQMRERIQNVAICSTTQRSLVEFSTHETPIRLHSALMLLNTDRNHQLPGIAIGFQICSTLDCGKQRIRDQRVLAAVLCRKWRRGTMMSFWKQLRLFCLSFDRTLHLPRAWLQLSQSQIAQEGGSQSSP